MDRFLGDHDDIFKGPYISIKLPYRTSSIGPDFFTRLRQDAPRGSTGRIGLRRRLRPDKMATGASWACYFRALKIGDASKVAPVDKFSLLLVAVFAVVFLGERPSVREWTGILMIGAGVLVLAFKR